MTSESILRIFILSNTKVATHVLRASGIIGLSVMMLIFSSIMYYFWSRRERNDIFIHVIIASIIGISMLFILIGFVYLGIACFALEKFLYYFLRV